MNKYIDEIIKLNVGECLKDEKLSKHTTYKVGGVCNLLVIIKEEEKLIKLINYLKNNNILFKIIGNGSNLIFSSKRFDGVIIKYNNSNYSIDNNILTVSSGVNVISLVMKLARMGYKNLDFASGLPGCIGGLIFMNAGCYMHDTSEFLISVDYLNENGKIITVNKDDIGFGYRTSNFKKNILKGIIISAKFKLDKCDSEILLKEIKERKEKRIASQPVTKATAGSVFKNPEGISAWKVIDDAGLRGYKIGGAIISNMHSNFIENTGNATGEDIKDLIEYTKKIVKEKFNIELETEQEFVNF